MEVFILAAGKGTRMKSVVPKPLLKVGGSPLVFHIIEKLKNAGLKNITVITGFKAGVVEKTISKKYKKVKFFRQKELNGSGGAIKNLLEKNKKVGDTFIVVNSDDSLFYDPEEIKEIVKAHKKHKYFASLFITKEFLGRSYRKIFLNKKKEFKKFTKRKSKSGYTVTGFYVFNKSFIEKALRKIKPTNDEIGLTDFMYLPGIKKKIYCQVIKPENWFGVNTKEELKLARKLWKQN